MAIDTANLSNPFAASVVFGGILLLLSLFIVWRSSFNRRSLNSELKPVPKVGGRWPLLGNLLQLKEKKPFKTFCRWAEIYGPIYSIKLGSSHAIVLNSAHVCKEVGAEQSSPNSISSGTQPTGGGGSGESSWHRNDRFSGGQQTSGKSQTMWKPVASKASSGEGCPPSRADLEARSPELNYRAEIVEGGLMQSEKSDLSSYYTKKGSADRSPRENHGSPRVNSSVSSKSSSQRNERPSGQRRTSQQRDTDWVVAKPVAFKGSTQFEKSDLSSDRTVGVSKPIVLEKGSADGPLDLDRSLMKNPGSEDEKSSVATAHNSLPHCEDPNSVGGSKSSKECDSSQQSECVTDAGPFDICPPKAGLPFVVKPSLLDTNRENRKQRNQSLLPKGRVLRSGMVLLKNYIPVSEQVNIVKECRKLGLGTGGFYQPGFRNGAKSNLRMMCLGKAWDCVTKSYGNIRPFDDAKPPPIPIKFLDLVIRSIKESHSLISEECGSIKRAEAILPWLSPDFCLVNFYTTSGRLGLHKDKHESEGSLRKGLPVVSVSIGDSAEFLYGDEREVEKAEMVTLESGDVLIFGGDSRHVFHGVDSIKPNTAPKSLLKETDLRPGRLNLTFRQY